MILTIIFDGMITIYNKTYNINQKRIFELKDVNNLQNSILKISIYNYVYELDFIWLSIKGIGLHKLIFEEKDLDVYKLTIVK